MSNLGFGWWDDGTAWNGNYNGIYKGTIKYWSYLNNGVANSNGIKVTTFNLEEIDTMRENILKMTSNPFNIFAEDLEPYKWLSESPNGYPNILNSQEGLGIKTYQSDLFNNWLETSWINQINNQSAVSTIGNKFNIDQLVLAKNIYNMLNRIAVCGGIYDDWIESVYDHKPYNRAESPIYHGGLIKELVFQEVISNTQTQDQPLGTMAVS